jgi:hypothetical protein
MFERLTLDGLKQLIKQYKLSTQIKLSKLIDGKRKTLTKKELVAEVSKHLSLDADGTVINKYRPNTLKVIIPTTKEAKRIYKLLDEYIALYLKYVNEPDEQKKILEAMIQRVKDYYNSGKDMPELVMRNTDDKIWYYALNVSAPAPENYSMGKTKLKKLKIKIKQKA